MRSKSANGGDCPVPSTAKAISSLRRARNSGARNASPVVCWIAMARAMKLAVEAGRLAYRAGRMGKRRYADPSSPLAGLI